MKDTSISIKQLKAMQEQRFHFIHEIRSMDRIINIYHSSEYLIDEVKYFMDRRDLALRSLTQVESRMGMN